MVGIIPVTISTFFVYNKRLSDTLKQASELNLSIQKKDATHALINIPSKNKSEELNIDIFNLLAVKSVENYVEVYFQKENQVQKEVIRNSLKGIEKVFFPYKFIQKCHRSSLVNLKAVIHFSGNAQGLNLTFDQNLKLEIPVSRSYVKTIKEQLTHINN